MLGCINKPAKFVEELSAQFLIEPKCSGLRFAEYPGFETKLNREWMAKPHWMLVVPITPGYAAQDWKMNLSSAEALGIVSGKGTAQEIARDVCSIANQSGAEVLR